MGETLPTTKRPTKAAAKKILNTNSEILVIVINLVLYFNNSNFHTMTFIAKVIIADSFNKKVNYQG